MVLGGIEMGMDLSSSHILLTEKQFKELEEGKFYFKSCYDLELIDWYEAENKKKSVLFDALEETLREDTIELPIGTNLEEYIKDELYIDKEEYPITLKEFLDYQYGDWIENTLYEEELDGEPVFLIIQLRYW